MKVVILEDEKAAVRNLRSLLADVLPAVEIVAVLDSITDAVSWFLSNPVPELVFMDIHLADGSAFEVLDLVRVECPIIFTTAYDEYALRAFKVNSIDYLLKPIAREDICQALDKLGRLQNRDTAIRKEDMAMLLHELKREEGYKNYFLIPAKGDKLIPLPVDLILCFYIHDGIVKALTTEDREYVLSQSLDELEICLNPQRFFRVNRQFIISRPAVRDIDLWFNGRLSVNLFRSFDEKILVSKQRAGEFKEWFSRG